MESSRPCRSNPAILAGPTSVLRSKKILWSSPTANEAAAAAAVSSPMTPAWCLLEWHRLL